MLKFNLLVGYQFQKELSKAGPNVAQLVDYSLALTVCELRALVQSLFVY